MKLIGGNIMSLALNSIKKQEGHEDKNERGTTKKYKKYCFFLMASPYSLPKAKNREHVL